MSCFSFAFVRAGKGWSRCNCPKCGERAEAIEQGRGRYVDCPACGALFQPHAGEIVSVPRTDD